MHTNAYPVSVSPSFIAKINRARSVTFRVVVGGSDIPVLQFGDIDYVHFACPRAVSVEVQRLDTLVVETCQVRPRRLGSEARRNGDTVRFSVQPGQKLIVNVDRLRKLFVFAELPDGAHVQDVRFCDIDTEEISMYVQPGYDEYKRIGEPSKGASYLLQLQVRKRNNTPLGRIADVVFENINARVAAGSKLKAYNVPEGATLIRNVTFRNLRIEGQLIRDRMAGRFDINGYVQNVRFETTDQVPPTDQ